MNLIDLIFQLEGQTNMVPGKLWEKRLSTHVSILKHKAIMLETSSRATWYLFKQLQLLLSIPLLIYNLSSHWYGIFKFPIVYSKHCWFSVTAYVARYSYFLHQFQKPCCYIQQQNPLKCRLLFLLAANA